MTRRALVIGSSIAALLLCARPAAAQNAAETPSLIVRGESTLVRAPEVAWLRASATGRGEKSDDARRKSADAMTDIQAGLKRLNIPVDAVRTVSYVLQPEYDRVGGESRFRGFAAINSIEVRIDDVANVVGVVDAIASVTFASVESLRFDLKDPASAKKEAMGLAVADALATAKAMAQGAGKTVGDLIKVQEEGAQFTDPFNLRMVSRGFNESVAVSAAPPAPAPAATPIVPGKVTVVGRVVLMVAVR